MVDGHSLDRLPAESAAGPRGTDIPGKVRCIHQHLPSQRTSGTAARCPELAIQRGFASGRSYEPVDAFCRWSLRRNFAEPERRTSASCGALEVRLQECEVPRENYANGQDADYQLERSQRT